jgi:hypothetical protein
MQLNLSLSQQINDDTAENVVIGVFCVCLSLSGLLSVQIQSPYLPNIRCFVSFWIIHAMPENKYGAVTELLGLSHSLILSW